MFLPRWSFNHATKHGDNIYEFEKSRFAGLYNFVFFFQGVIRGMGYIITVAGFLALSGPG